MGNLLMIILNLIIPVTYDVLLKNRDEISTQLRSSCIDNIILFMIAQLTFFTLGFMCTKNKVIRSTLAIILIATLCLIMKTSDKFRLV